MSVFTSTNNEALGKLLADLFPNVALSEAGVLLLAAQISNLGGRCATMHSRPIDHKRAKRTFTSAQHQQPRGKVRRLYLPTEACRLAQHSIVPGAGEILPCDPK
jgi:hypothetical protein